MSNMKDALLIKAIQEQIKILEEPLAVRIVLSALSGDLNKLAKASTLMGHLSSILSGKEPKSDYEREVWQRSEEILASVYLRDEPVN